MDRQVALLCSAQWPEFTPPLTGAGNRLVMLARHMIVDQNRPMVEHADGKLSGWTWATSGMGFSLVGATDAADLHPLADEIRLQVTTSS